MDGSAGRAKPTSRRRIFAFLAVFVLVSFGYFILAPRQFGFIGQLEGRLVPLPPELEQVGLAFGTTLDPGSDGAKRTKDKIREYEAQERIYVFRVPPDKVFEAMKRELESGGWTLDHQDGIGAISGDSGGEAKFVHSPLEATFASGGAVKFLYGQDVTCVVYVPKERSIVAKLLPAVRSYL